MGRMVHRCDTPDGPRYREWSTNVDAYVSPILTREKMAAQLMRDGGSPRVKLARESLAQSIKQRLARADAHGSSGWDDERDMSAWATERCDGCHGFHHAYKPRADGTCGHCGEGADYTIHKPECETR